MRPQDLAPNVITYSAAISACEKGQQPRSAMNLLTAMQPQDLAPNVITYSALISACTKGGQWEHAPELLAGLATKMPPFLWLGADVGGASTASTEHEPAKIAKAALGMGGARSGVHMRAQSAGSSRRREDVSNFL